MKPILHISSILLFMIAILFANPSFVLADEGDAGHPLEMEINGYHITLASQNDWAKGANTIVVTLTDRMGMPVRDTQVELLIAPKLEDHAETETDPHGAEQQYESMPGMDMGVPTEESPAHAEAKADPISMTESDEHGMYVVETRFESSGTHEVHVMFHANGEMLQGDFVVEIPGMDPKTIVLWSFATVNIALVATAGVIKKQKTVSVKGV